MSLGGRDEPSLGVLVYGPDGRAYGSPAEARNAGVSNPTMSPPADVPLIPYGRAATPRNSDISPSDFEGSLLGPDLRVSNMQTAPQPYTPAPQQIAPAIQPYTPAPQQIAPAIQPYTPAPMPMPSIPTQSSGGRNRYAEIMAQYAQSQPYSFTSMPPSYTGGFTGYPSDYTGGFTPYTPQPAAPVTRYEEIMAQPAMGGGGRGMQEASEPRYNPLSPLATPESGSIGFQILDAYGRTKVLPYAFPAGLISQSMLPSQLEQAGINAAKAFADAQAGYAAGTMFGAPPSDASTFAGGGYGPIGTQTTPTGAGIAASPMSIDPAQAQRAIAQAQADASAAAAAQDARVAAFDASRESGRGGGGGGGGMGGASNANPGDPGRGGGGAHLAKGGYVSMQHLLGPNPEGPDDGYAALKDGEFVINDKAVKKYGIELMQAINSGKISKGKLRGLLEM